MRAVIISGKYNSLMFGEVLEVEDISSTFVRFKGKGRVYQPKVAAYVDDEGNPLTITDAARIMRGKR